MFWKQPYDLGLRRVNDMRKITACEFMTLDGVIQNEENDGDGFKWSGWFFPYADEVSGAVIQERLAKPVDLLLGRKTFDGWETYWPTHSNFWPNVMTATKYVASNTRNSSDWQPNVFLSGDIAEKVRELKEQDGPDIYVMGLSLIHISEPTRQAEISYAVFCLK